MKADKDKITAIVKTARGQLDGIMRMIDNDRYCIEISNQLRAAAALLQKANKEVLRAHMENCLRDAFESGDYEKAVDEVLNTVM